MDESQLYPFLFTFVAIFFTWYKTTTLKSGSRGGKKNLPPSPPRLPVIGNLHQLGKLPHRSLWNLSKKYGPLMLLHLGSRPALVVSTAYAAKETLKKYGHDLRKMRSMFVQERLSSNRVKSYNSILEEEITLILDKIKDRSVLSKPANLTNMFAELTYDLISRAALGKKQGKELLHVLEEIGGFFFNFTLGEFVPQLDWINCLTGYHAALDDAVERREVILDALIEDHLSSNEDSSEREENFLDFLIRTYKDDSPKVSSIDLKSVKAAILDVFTGGNETSPTTLVWVMTELIKHPKVMQNLQDEIRELMKEKQHITDHDLHKMHYLKTVIKETFRLHTPMVTYSRAERMKVMGYDVPPETMVIINTWAIGRDPSCWDEPEKFMPERFLNSDLDFRGFDFQLIPFGAGQRICPGLDLAATTIEHTIANLVHKFDWALPDGANGEDLDVTEKPGLTIGNKYPLIVVPSLSLNK